MRHRLHALAYNFTDFLRTLAAPKTIEQWSLTSLRERLIKIGARLARQGRYTIFQVAAAAFSQDAFVGILELINILCGPPGAVVSP